ncbi:ATP-dependent RNA helicase DbpA [Marinobacterium sediminicola]|uniref:ATP-dependent RNA helicase DbpA n=1 Tax=Marinobacterium sediminicola TaxID=518898 RepID=A0ABY1RVU1_9GAMM|nr:ATP-dependent RNA helicase DbpA [Marinobacterium sediminicola]ULG70543.1 ATP-dependent RNA helicase DbpA [Marinobacterium sediminicola]SMR69047.1 ATP-dependent RNA helicase DbpA [Marinobacterium sediminicola]
MSQLPFSHLSLKSELLRNLESLEYHYMTPIQQDSLPVIIEGRDLIAQGKTGSGKTAAFGLGLLQGLDSSRFHVQSLVLCPTRELADQVAQELRRLARQISNVKVLTLCGGMPLGPQIGSLEHGAHIVVGTPGRIEEHLRKGTLQLNRLQILVLDEADRMLEMGFQDAVDAIVAATPELRQTLLFSATYPQSIEAIAARIMREPVKVEVEALHKNTSIEQHFHSVEDEQRDDAVTRLIFHYRPVSAVVFCNTKQEVRDLEGYLQQSGIAAVALHGDLDQRQRDQTLVRFANQSSSVLVATDVAARGLDIEGLDLVINHRPSKEAQVHVHRIGRTGRAGQSGVAVTLFNERERFKLAAVEAQMDMIITPTALPKGSAATDYRPPMATLQLDVGKKQKIRPGDVLGALTKGGELTGDQVGKIRVFDFCTYVAVSRPIAREAVSLLSKGKVKGRSCRVRQLR